MNYQIKLSTSCNKYFFNLTTSPVCNEVTQIFYNIIFDNIMFITNYLNEF